MFKNGTITERNPATGMVRVSFLEDENIVSDWISIVVPFASKNSLFAMPDVGEQVACMMDEHCENGVCLGAIYSNDVKPKQSGDDISSVEFSDGTKVIYDRGAHTLNIDTKGDITIKTTKNVKIECLNATVKASATTKIDSPNTQITGILTVDGNIIGKAAIQAVGDIRAGNGVTGLLTHTHSNAAGPTTPGVG
jgi:phage baseplate assembly protein V